jgi:hypothetical protein
MGIDAKKLKKTLEKHNIYVIEYFCMDNDCAMLKCFLSKVCEYLLIYIPSALRFEMNVSDYKNAYELVDLDENTENDDYSKSDKVPDMDTIDEDKSVSTYQELTKKYQKSISLDGNDEPVQRKLKRQIDRLRLPFKRLKYELALQSGRTLSVAFDDSISMFRLKGYENDVNRNVLFLINVNDFIEEIELVDEHIHTIKNQFYDIIRKVSISNLESISDQISDYKSVMSKIIEKKESYIKLINEYKSLYQRAKANEKELIEEYKQKLQAADSSVKKSMIEGMYDKKIKEHYSAKNEIVKRGMILALGYQTALLILEETSFDNTIMIDRVSKNFELLRKSF